MSDMAPSKVKRPNEKVDISKDVKTTGEHRVGEGRGESDLLVVNSAVVRSDAIGCSIGAVEASMMPRGSSSLGAGVGNGISFRSPRVIGLVTASTFLLCFLLFGVINITAGTLITLASMRIDEEHSGTAMVTDPTPTAILLSDRPSPSNLSQAEATLSSIFGLPAGKQRGYQMKPQGHRGAIDARRLVGIVLLFAGTALICIGGGIGYVACCSVASGSSLSLAPCKRSLKTSFVVEREILVITTALGEQRQPPSSNSPPPPLDV